jgi:hypothetical protein
MDWPARSRATLQLTINGIDGRFELVARISLGDCESLRRDLGDEFAELPQAAE